MTLAAPDPAGRARRAWVVLPAALLLLPALAERLGLPVEEDSLRLPLAMLAIGCALLAGSGSAAGRSTWFLAALAALSGAALLGADPLTAVGAPYVPLLGVGALLLGAACLRDDEARRALARGLLVAATLAAAWTLVDFAEGRPAVGPFGRAGVAGPALGALLPFLALAPSVPGPRRAWRAVPLLLAGAALAATASRTGALAGALGLATAWAANRRGRTPVRAVFALLGLILLAFVALVAGAAPPTSFLGRADTVRVRAGIARAAVTLVREHPTGRGPHGFAADVVAVRDLEEARISDGRRPLLAHDDVLEAAVDGGVLAGVALLLLLGIAPWRAVRATRREVPGPARSFLAAAAGSLVAVALASLAEDPMASTTTAALFGLLAGATCGGLPAAAGAPRAGRAVAVVVAVALLAAGAVHARALLGSPEARLKDGSFRWDERSRADAYAHAAGLAKAGRLPEARAAYERLIAWDAGATEARLDLAETYRVEGRAEDAVAILEEARRADPTRYDVPQRLGHLTLGPEAPPSKRTRVSDPLPALRLYNEAAALAPGRFETPVAYARVHRRSGDLNRASEALRAARDAAAARGQGLPGELLLESFRVAEAQGASSGDSLRILALALAASGPGVAAEILGEAEACLDAAEATEATAKADAEAGALRYGGLLVAGRVAPTAVRAAAEKAAAQGRHRRALALYRGILADPFAAADPDLALAARESATHVDRDAAEILATRSRVLLGFESLGKGDAAGAEKHFVVALARDERNVAAHYGLARALARQVRWEEAGKELARAVALEPSVAERAATDPDLVGVKAPPR